MNITTDNLETTTETGFTAKGYNHLTPLATNVIFGGSGEPGIEDLAEIFHEASKLSKSLVIRQLSGVLLAQTPPFKEYAARSTKRHWHRPNISLPEPSLPTTPFDQLIMTRRSSRTFPAAPLPVSALSTLLFAGYGVTGEIPGAPHQKLRAAPSGGALYPLDIYVLAHSISGLPAGTYHYDPLRHCVEVLSTSNPTPELLEACVQNELFEDNAATIIITSTFGRTRCKYGLRGYRFALFEAGHVAQNIILAATGMDVVALPVGGYYDRQIDALVGADGVDESVVYVMSIGGQVEVAPEC